jgi:transcriptional regulator with XRE-family HTH domain
VSSPDSTELARRLRAIHAYTGLAADDFAQLLGVSPRTLARMENEAKVDLATIQHAADHAGIPAAFADHGFQPLERPLTPTDRKILDVEYDLRSRIDTLEDEITRLAEIVLDQELLTGWLEARPDDRRDKRQGDEAA